MPSKKRATPVSLQPLDALFGTNEETTNGISEIAIGSLHPFTNHPFQVRDDKKMEELAESITQYGVLVPGIVRLRESGGYELVAGHRRKRACELAGLEKMPVIIKDLTDDEATVIMVDSNIQREELLISEKAFAYKMKYEALKRQGKRSDLTSCQVGKKLAAEEVSQNTGDSSRQILRYIHLTELIAKLLELADEKKLPFNTEKNHTDKSKGNTPALEEKFSLNGRFKNVVLSEAELQELMTLFPWDYQKRIDHLSVYMKSSGKEYQNHFATICLWSERDGARAGRDKYEFQEGESL
ncbi:ParB/RepB/Spo0J family partition protein [Coprococcus comes]|uniref:ParB/RepB/Spo0J family partition protein n=1 Tax=Coprococcus comes TaxID=410072 RepID=UPI001FAB4D9E|nr:ParB/RepB/Spo0J family partition protein [Coprococcus comes]